MEWQFAELKMILRKNLEEEQENLKNAEDELDSWKNQKAIDLHHQTSMMQEIIALREKYDLRMKVERYTSEELSDNDKHFIRNS